MDGKGVMGMPMRLAVAFVLLSICIPVLTSTAQGVEDGMDIDLCREEAGKLHEKAQKVYYGGTGTTSYLELEIPAGYEIHIGGLEQDAYSVRICHGNDTVETIYMDKPVIRFIGGENIISGISQIRVECTRADGIYGVGVTPI